MLTLAPPLEVGADTVFCNAGLALTGKKMPARRVWLMRTREGDGDEMDNDMMDSKQTSLSFIYCSVTITRISSSSP